MKMNRSNQRSGVTLLMVMSIIVLFLLMGTTFVIISNNFLKSARQTSKFRLKGDQGQVLVERALYDIIRGPDLNNTMSPLRGHSLLADMYGYGFTGRVDGTPTFASTILGVNQPFDTAGQLIEFDLNLLPAFQPKNILNPTSNASLSGRPGFYNGFVLSFVSAAPLSEQAPNPDLNNQPAALNQALSGRIIGYEPPAKFLVMLDHPEQDLVVGTDANGIGELPELKNCRVVVNSRPFSGFGAGGDSGKGPTAGKLDIQALIPNRRGESLAQLRANYLTRNNSPNESYDAADFQNMFLFGRDNTGDVIPSFYRKSLTGDWDPLGTQPDADANDFVKHGWAMVDNDNDMELDSYWMDIGLPMQSDGSGRIYKPMVAYKIEDLDGRLNLNSHGSLAETQTVTRIPLLGGGQANAQTHSLGQGYGPAEISMSRFFGNEYKNILEGRYGADLQPGISGPDAWSDYKLFENARGKANTTDFGTVGRLRQQAGSYGSSAQDLRGQYFVGTPSISGWTDPNFDFNNSLPSVDVLSDGTLWTDELADHPYEAFPYWAHRMTPNTELQPTLTDTPYSLPELEKVIRRLDQDNPMLPSRLLELAPNKFSDQTSKNSITTDSFEVPVVPFGMPEKLMAEMKPFFPNLNEAQLFKKIKDDKLLPDELFVGLKMNVNRPFGNGRDDNSNGVVDEAYYEVGGMVIGAPPTPAGEIAQRNVDQAGAWMDLDNNGDGGTGDVLARYHFAKQLYIMALLTCEEPAGINQDAFRKQIAQWAVNVVDFRDSDSIMTVFEYDTNPWNGWDVDGFVQQHPNLESPPNKPPGTPSKDRGVVFGCERPELLLTESIALHDRRTEDESKDDLYRPTDPNDPKDDDLDSRLVPNTAAFIEIYNPWTQNRLNQVLPPSLSDNPGSPKQANGIDLTRQTRRRDPNVPDSRDPVWRIQIKGVADPDWERAVYFTDTEPTNVTDVPRRYFTSCDVQPLAPGGHAVIGSANQDINNDETAYRTTIGRLTAIGKANESPAGNLELGTTRHIILDSSNQQVRTYNPVTQTTTTRNAVAIPINRSWRNPNQLNNNDPNPQSLSVSDPNLGYPLVDASGGPRVPIDDGYSYSDPYDLPRDPLPANGGDLFVWTNGLTDNYRVLHLQRLANPLEPWNEYQNPYISIDCMPMDLLAYNGVQQDPNNDNENPALVPPKIDPHVQGDVDTVLDTLERGESQTQARLLFKSDDGNTDEGPQNTVVDGHRLSFEFKGSLGATNESYRNNGGNLGFAWLTWNNRPFVSHLELANVPISAPDKITYNFATRNASESPYTRDVIWEEETTGDVDLSGEFRHLLNPFSGDDEGTHFYRLFDYLEVPSRFVGTEINLNHNRYNNNPFNFVPRYRVPGKINLNTIYSQDVWEGLMGRVYSSGNRGVSWGEFKKSRKRKQPPAGGPGGPAGINLNSFEFAGVFRNANEGNYVPDLSTTPPSTGPTLVREGFDCGLFRRHPDDDGQQLPQAGDAPLFVFNAVNPLANAYNHTNRSAYFAYDLRQRLGNLVTTRSSVFAIWITVGLFEVNDKGQVTTNELGSDSGEVRRHRGFFVLDRSIPVAFEPGKNHNVERAIRVSSFIE